MVNIPSPDVPYTRISEYKHLTGQEAPVTTITYEYPSAEGDPYYPIPRPENQELFKRYEALADATEGVTFVGRLATYRYYNMDQIVGQALATFRRMDERKKARTGAQPRPPHKPERAGTILTLDAFCRIEEVPMRQNWPERLWLVRHGQSQGNVARDAADEAGAHEIDIDMRDVDVPLSDLGIEQAEAAGRWFAALPRDERPEIILVFALCPRTADGGDHLQAGRARGRPGPHDRRRAAARARVRDLRSADHAGIRAALPRRGRAPAPARQILPPAARRRELGRRDPAPALDAQHDQPALLRPARAGRLPPGRGAVLPLHPRGARRGAILGIDKQAEVLNCGIATYDFEPDAKGLCMPELELWNYGAPLEAEGAPKTSAPDAMAGTR